MSSLPSNIELKLDNVQERGFDTFFGTVCEKPSTTIQFFDRSDFYTVHGADVHYVAKEIFKSSTCIKTFGPKKAEYVTLSRINYEATLRHLLLVKRYRVEVYKNYGTKTNTDWKLAFKASPGNLTQVEDILFGSEDVAVGAGVMAIKVQGGGGGCVVGVAYTDVTLHLLQVAQFADNDQFSNLEAMLVQLAPAECLLCPDVPHVTNTLTQVVSRSHVLVTERKKADFSSKDNVQDLSRLLSQKRSAASVSEAEHETAMCSLAAVMRYLDLLADEANFGQFTLSSVSLSTYMRLDAAAVCALNLLPSAADGGNAAASVLGLLNHCCTAGGGRLLAMWIRQPLLDVGLITERHDLVAALVADSELRHGARDEHLRRMPDVQRLAHRLQRKKAQLQDIYKVYQAVGRVPHLVETLSRHTGPHQHLLRHVILQPLQDLIMDFAKFTEMVEATLDLAAVEQHEFLVKADFDDRLQELREELQETEGEMKGCLSKAAHELRLEAEKVLKLESTPQLGYFFRITRKEERVLRDNRAYVIMDTNKAGVRFRNSRLTELNTEYLQAKRSYCEQQASLVEEIVAIASGYCEPLLQLGTVLAQLDVLASFAHVAVAAPTPYTRPILHPPGSGHLTITGLRHACLEMQDDVAFIPNDVAFNTETQAFHIITGPNMGGKSTYIRSVGVAVCLAQLGCFVPADHADISLVDCVLARVGAGDSTLKAVSTFMSEMLETGAILRCATPSSLVIIDELGRGTSTYDGFGLAWAIAHCLATQVRAFTLFATHFHELTALAAEVACVHNVHVTALTTAGALTLLYRVRPGVCDQSFGIHVAELAHFPQHVIESARVRASQLEMGQCLPGGGGDSTSTEQRRRDQQEGERIMREFVCDAQLLCGEADLTDDELMQRLATLRTQLLDNAYLTEVLAGTA